VNHLGPSGYISVDVRFPIRQWSRGLNSILNASGGLVVGTGIRPRVMRNRMALHDTVVRRIKNWHESNGDDVTAELKGYQRPPKFTGSRGRRYIPDVFVFNQRLAYEVKEYWAHRWAGPKLRAIGSDPRVRRLMLVLCSGTTGGAERARDFVEREGIPCEVECYRDLPCW
jgi:hypothetical protein